LSLPNLDPCLVLIAHMPMAAAFEQCAAHVLGASVIRKRLVCFDVEANAHIDHEVRRINTAILAQDKNEVVLLNDLYGATPYRIAHRVSQSLKDQGKQVYLVAGLSLPMLLKAITDAPNDGLEAYVKRIAETADRGAVVE